MAENQKRSHLGAYVDALVQHAAGQIKSIDRTTGETIGDSIGEPNGETIGQSVHSPIGQTIDESLDQPSAEPVIRINETQFILWNCIRSINGGLTSLARISAATGIPADTLKSALRRLRETGAITHYRRGNCNGLHGFTARTNERRRINLIGAARERVFRRLRGIDFSAMRIDEGTPIHLLDQRFDDRLAHPMPALYAESSSSNLNTKLLNDVEDALETHPDMELW
ncbi:MAG: hypothetical protein PHI99_04290, partial [Syntrophales bacterium]|nr:hypothetical protein [Syntrophales bacterium]